MPCTYEFAEFKLVLEGEMTVTDEGGKGLRAEGW